MTADELRGLLEPYGIRPIRDRGQHFLLDERVVGRMAEAAGIGPGSRVVEIGPGPGILTAELLERGADVVAVELDRKLAALLRDRFGANPRFHLLEGDALNYPNTEIVAAFGAPSSELRAPSYKVVANLPYAITSNAIRKFLLEPPYPVSVTVMIQREVADRLLAKTGDMSGMAVLVRSIGEASSVVKVPARSFYPPPRVDSSVIHIARKDPAILEAFFYGFGQDRFFAIVRAAFAGKRKQLKNSLQGIGIEETGLFKAFSEAGIRPEARPETLSVEDWRRLVLALTE
ncbi:MAG TPA: 16S rRNA (adenine(1518)-N(6)/adenine(1519)-N(6))-dimethyltransferase RsmA [Candidatus Eisenbacteria bacterium]|jgi:16S rRNA (adenine1518-N6/adenine1519-N6)-dimethyltransferase|nr:16S rRNA (adenine(1518)-N(6)/adenine(1519)-N(6))-dimethyltransferase RsmA [Candidatus Eisenbacteria bacterium]